MGEKLSRARLDERGAATAEYAAVTVAGCGFAGLLYKLLTSDMGEGIVRTLFDTVVGFLK